MKTVGMHKVSPITKDGDEGSHAVYPLASKVFLSPPLGNEDASGSCWHSTFPVNDSMASPGPEGWMKESCFSAVSPVRGWNQCV